MSHARAHFQRASAAKASALVGDESPVNCSAYELMLVKLAEDRRQLKLVHSMERKAEVKRQVLPDYLPWVEGALQSDSGRPDDVVTTVMMWSIDAGCFSTALDIAEYVLRHDLPLPDQFTRTPATAVVDQFAIAAKVARDGKKPFDVGILVYTNELTKGHDIPDAARAKLLKEIGLALAESDPAGALEHLRRAQQLYDSVGVKKDIERLERKLKNTSPPQG